MRCQFVIPLPSGVTQQMVAIRLKLNSLPDKVKRFTSQGLLTESHLFEIGQLQVDLYSWLTSEQAWQELVARAVKSKLTLKDTRAEVSKLKEVITLAAERPLDIR
jgi:hypothetical protein